MPSNILLLLPLIGGYWFIHAFVLTKYRSQALDGYRLLLESIGVGLVFTAFAYFFSLTLTLYFPRVENEWYLVVPRVPYLGSVVIGTLLGFFGAYPANGVLRAFGFTPEIARARAIAHNANQFHQILQDAIANERPVSVTLDNRKVYIGLVSVAPTLAPNANYFSLTPLFSGYRENETLNLVLTVNYVERYEGGLNPKDFEVVMPIGNVRMIAFFDPAVYGEFVVEQDTGEGPEQPT